MKSLIITEIEKKSILHNYTSNNSSSSTLNEELNKIGNLMGITPKFNLVSEESILTKGIFNLPMFKEYNKYLKDIGSEGAEELLQKDISELSPRLRQDGITNDNLAAKARDYWSKQSLKGETQLKGQDDVDLVDWFLKEKYADEIFDINTRVLRTLEEKQNSTLKSISTGLDLRLPDGTNPKFKENFTTDVSVDDVSLTKSDVDKSIDDLIEGEKFCDNKIKKLQDQKEAAKAQGDTNLINNLNAKIRQWDELKKSLTEKRQIYENWKANYDTIYNKIPKTNVKIAGVEYDMTSLTALQKFLMTNAITKQFQIIHTLSKMWQIYKVGNVAASLGDSIAGLRNALGQPPNSTNFTDIDAYTQNVVSTLKALTGRPKEIITDLNFFKKIGEMGGKLRTSFDDEWRNFLNQLDASDLTPAEQEQVKKTILEKFAKPDATKWEQFAIFNDDVKTILNRLGSDEAGTKLQNEYDIARSKRSWLGDLHEYYKQYLLHPILGKTWKEWLPGILNTFIRIGFSGLVTGMRNAVAPLIKFGINPKGIMRTFMRLYLIKTSYSVAAASFVYGIKNLYYYGMETLGADESYTKKSYDEWSSEVWNEYMGGLGESLKTWPLETFSFGYDEKETKGTKIFGGDVVYRKFKSSEIIFRQYAVEWAAEWYDQLRSTKSEETVYNTAEQTLQEWQKETKTNWVDNAIESAGPENTKTYLNGETNLPVFQNTILDLLKDSTISSHLYYRFDFSTETPPGFDTQKTVTGKFDNFTPSLSNVMGQVRICETLPINLSDGTQKCKGNSWRVDVFNPYDTSRLNHDENFNKYYDMAKSGVGSGPLFEKAKKMKEQEIIYVTNPDEGEKVYPSIGIDMVNVAPIENIKSKLK
jgi:hypothetical protein